MSNNKPIHILRYGTVAEKVHLEKAISAYDYLSINGNTAAYVSGAIAQFIVEKFFSNNKKGFFIDPITYAFQNKIELLNSNSTVTGKSSIKKSVQKLIEVYDYPIKNVEKGHPVVVDDFKDNNLNLEFCRRVLSFQYDLVYEHINSNDLEKYLEYVAADQIKNIPQLRPKFLIAPYFYIDISDPMWKEWLKLNVNFVNLSTDLSKKDYNEKSIFAQIVINKQTLLCDEAVDLIAESYCGLECFGYTIWIDDFAENEATAEELSACIKLLKKLNKKPIFNMYGGYFSILLTNKDLRLLSGVSHGLEYGESRKVYPVGGGVPVSKYYFLPLHQRLDFTKAFYLLEYENIIDTEKPDWGDSGRYYEEICKCQQCRKVIKDKMINFVEFESREFYEIHKSNKVLRRKKASPDTKQNCLYHYLLCKKVEFTSVNKFNIDYLLEKLKESGERFSKCSSVSDKEFEYINRWIGVLSKKDNG